MQSYYYADVEQDVSAFLQKNQSALLSLYATADMGIHYDGWTLRDTIDSLPQLFPGLFLTIPKKTQEGNSCWSLKECAILHIKRIPAEILLGLFRTD